jgi:hypothetical protein
MRQDDPSPVLQDRRLSDTLAVATVTATPRSQVGARFPRDQETCSSVVKDRLTISVAITTWEPEDGRLCRYRQSVEHRLVAMRSRIDRALSSRRQREDDG